MYENVFAKRDDNRFFVSNFRILYTVSRVFSFTYSLGLFFEKNDWQSSKTSRESDLFIKSKNDRDKRELIQFSLQDVEMMHKKRLTKEGTTECITEIEVLLLKANKRTQDAKAKLALEELKRQSLLFVQKMVECPQNYQHILDHYNKNEFLQDWLYHDMPYSSLIIIRTPDYLKELIEKSMAFANTEISAYLSRDYSHAHSEDNNQKNKLLSMIQEELGSVSDVEYRDDVSELSDLSDIAAKTRVKPSAKPCSCCCCSSTCFSLLKKKKVLPIPDEIVFSSYPKDSHKPLE